MSERLTKKQLKEDPLLKTTGETIDFARHHVRLLVGIVAAGLLLVAIVVFVRGSSTRSEDRAAGILAEARAELARGALDPAAQRLESLIATMGGTSSGRQAKLILGDVRFNQGRFAEAATAYEQALDAYRQDAIISLVARRGLAASRENLGQYDLAAQTYTELADATENTTLRAQILMAVARNLVRAGNTAEARTLYQQLAETADNPSIAQEAGIRLAELGG